MADYATETQGKPDEPAENMEVLVEPQTERPGCSSAEAVLYTVEVIPPVLQARHSVNNWVCASDSFFRGTELHCVGMHANSRIGYGCRRRRRSGYR